MLLAESKNDVETKNMLISITINPHLKISPSKASSKTREYISSLQYSTHKK